MPTQKFNTKSSWNAENQIVATEELHLRINNPGFEKLYFEETDNGVEPTVYPKDVSWVPPGDFLNLILKAGKTLHLAGGNGFASVLVG